MYKPLCKNRNAAFRIRFKNEAKKRDTRRPKDIKNSWNLIRVETNQRRTGKTKKFGVCVRTSDSTYHFKLGRAITVEETGDNNFTGLYSFLRLLMIVEAA